MRFPDRGEAAGDGIVELGRHELVLDLGRPVRARAASSIPAAPRSLPRSRGRSGACLKAMLSCPVRTGVSRSLTNNPQFVGIFAGSNAGRAVSAAGSGRDSVDSGSRSLGSPNPFLAPG
jgi:hypothetical protein